jgi:3-phosphoinositide dependent protein kinase-1
MDHHIGALNKSLGALHVTNDNTPTTSTYSNSPIVTPTDQTQHSRNTSRGSTVSSTENQNIPLIITNDSPLSRHDTRSSQASARGKLPDAADPEYSYVYVPPLSSLPTSTKNPDIEGNSMRSDISGRSANSSRKNAFLDIGSPTHSGRPRSSNAMSGNHSSPNRVVSQDRNGRLRDRTRSEEWADRGAAVAVKESTSRNGTTSTRVIKKGVKDFQFGRTLGEGSYSTVVAATDRSTLKEYAIKMLDKRHIIKEKKVKYVNIEKNTLNRLGDHPGIVKLYFTFQDETTLYFVLDLAVNGELLGFIKKVCPRENNLIVAWYL